MNINVSLYLFFASPSVIVNKVKQSL